MDFVKLFTSFSGRIGRKYWWIGMIIVVVVEIGGLFLLDPDSFSSTEPVTRPTLAATLWGLFFVIPGAALYVKRFNDRNYPFWFGYAAASIGAIFYIAEYFGYLLDIEAMLMAEDLLGPGTLLGQMIFLGIAGLIFLFILIDNGFLRGTKGPNRYGEDPLGRQHAPGQPPSGGDWAG